MPSSEANEVPTSRGGLVVALLVFFVLGLAFTLAAQAVVFRHWGQGDVGIIPMKSAKARSLVQPSPELEPNQVVSIQLDGLAKNPETGGIEQCYVFASPGNKIVTGPIERFSAMLHCAPYDVLLSHHLVLVGKPIVNGDSANIVVTMLDARDRIFIFQFVLSKQHSEGYENCWMTDAVFPVQQIPSSPPSRVPTAQIKAWVSERFTKIEPPPSLGGQQLWGGVNG